MRLPVYLLYKLATYVMLCANRNNEFFVGHQILMPQLDCQVWFSLNTDYYGSDNSTSTLVLIFPFGLSFVSSLFCFFFPLPLL